MNNMIFEVQTLPELITKLLQPYEDAVSSTLDKKFCNSIQRIFVVGCGDSHHAALSSEFAFENLTGLPCDPMTALQFGRYASGNIPKSGKDTNLVIGVSVSGAVARTIEAVRMANLRDCTTLALTANSDSPIARETNRMISSSTRIMGDSIGGHTPGVWSYYATQLALMMIAVRIGNARGHLSNEDANKIRNEILGLASAAEKTIAICNQKALNLAKEWEKVDEFVFVGGGPNYASALFSAAKVLEASGDPAIGQETEEWTHLQYFARHTDTPTLFITAGERDYTRTIEAAIAAKAIKRRVAAIAPEDAENLFKFADRALPFAHVRELFSPLIAVIPSILFAAYRADVIGEPFFRNFAGGRELTEGNGVSRIRSSAIWDKLWTE